MAKDINEEMGLVAKALGCNFTLRDQPIHYDQVFSETGLLPAMARRADQLSSFCLGYGIGVSFEEVQGATLGVRVKFDEATPRSLCLLCLTDVLIELIHAGPSRATTPLDDLMYD
jgi:intracellular multiplication protein IcmS